MMYWLYIAISLASGEAGTWHHYPIDGWDSEKGCTDVQKGITAMWEGQYQEKSGKLWIFYCKAEAKT